MTKYIYRYAGYAIGYNVYYNGFSFTLDGKALSVDEFRDALQATGAHKETIESVVDDVYQGIREDALRQGWQDIAKLTIRT
jgi:SOS response regulatory protein OraA/RecX